MKFVLLFIMIFCHIVDDYYLQGCLANMKQKKWWKENAPQKLYDHDYIIALLMHSFSWTFMILLPLLVYMYINDCFFIGFYSISFVINMIIHAVVDDLKANRFVINLTTDQTIHLFQTIITFDFFCALV